MVRDERQKGLDALPVDVFNVDLHAHTRFFHGRRSIGDRFDPYGHRLLTWTAARRGLDGVATTNHDYYTPLSSNSVVTVPGIEITTTRGHLLVVGPDPPAETERGELTPREAVDRAHDRDCVAIVAHPYRNSTVREVTDVPFDAIEVNGKHPRTRSLVEALAEERGLPVVGGSDAHFPFEVGRAYTRIDADRLTPTSVVEAIRDGRVGAVVDERTSDRLVQGAYRAVHGHKGHLDRDEGPTPGVGVPPGENE